MVQLLIEKGAMVNIRDIDDQTPLFWAAASASVVSGRILIENGAKVNIRDVNSSTPLHVALNNDYISDHEDSSEHVDISGNFFYILCCSIKMTILNYKTNNRFKIFKSASKFIKFFSKLLQP